jgi:hypothetical protein
LGPKGDVIARRDFFCHDARNVASARSLDRGLEVNVEPDGIIPALLELVPEQKRTVHHCDAGGSDFDPSLRKQAS